MFDATPVQCTRMQRCAVLSALAIVTLLASACPGPSDDAIRTIRVFDMLTAYPRASVHAPKPEYQSVGLTSLEGDQRTALFMHAGSSAEFPAITVGGKSEFTAMIGLGDSVQVKPGDGVEFTVSVRLRDSTVVKVYSHYIDSRKNARERGWVAIHVPLAAFAGQSVRIILGTATGPTGDNQYDWSFWGEPRVALNAI